MKKFATCVVLGALAAMATPASAQQVPPGQSCGGLLCDMGVFGHKVAVNSDGSPPTPAQIETANREVAVAEAADPHRLPCHDFLCRAFGGKDEKELAAAAQPVPAPVAAPAEEPVKPAKRAHKAKRKQVAKAEAKTADAEPAAK